MTFFFQTNRIGVILKVPCVKIEVKISKKISYTHQKNEKK